MERVVRVGKYYYDVIYYFDHNTPQLEKVYALSELLLYDHSTPVMYESSDSIKLVDAERLRVDVGGQLTLARALQETLARQPKSDPTLQALQDSQAK